MQEPKADLVQISPNPTSSTITVGYEANAHPLSIAVLDASGRMVLFQSFTTSPTTFDLSGCEKGAYTLLVSFDDGTRSIERIVKD
jgi:hypothetical protein